VIAYRFRRTTLSVSLPDASIALTESTLEPAGTDPPNALDAPIESNQNTYNDFLIPLFIEIRRELTFGYEKEYQNALFLNLNQIFCDIIKLCF
jgi:hypothetical protein